MEDYTPAVILDCGTCFCRAGFSSDTDNSPSVIIPNIVGTPKCDCSNLSKAHYFGDSALANRKDLNIKYPVEYGHVTNWDEMQLMWRALIDNELKINPEDHPFLLVQPCNVSSYNLEKTAEIFFETFGVPSLCLMPSGVLSLLASGIHTGIAVEIGGGSCFCVPVLNGFGLRHLQQRTEFSGRDLTASLSKMISKNTCSNTEEGMPFDVVNSIKENVCYCAENYEKECSSFSTEKEILHHFSDMNGETSLVTIGMERFQCPESLFKPGLAKKEFPGLHEIVMKCCMVEDDRDKAELASNILLCGGSSLFPGLAPRLQHELEMAMAQECSKNIKVVVSPFRNAAFQGGKVAASSADFLNRCMSKEYYDENGPYEITSMFRR